MVRTNSSTPSVAARMARMATGAKSPMLAIAISNAPVTPSPPRSWSMNMRKAGTTCLLTAATNRSRYGRTISPSASTILSKPIFNRANWP